MRRSLFWGLLGNAAIPAGVFLSSPLLARGLGVQGRGDVAAATAPLMLLITMCTLGIPEALLYFRSSLGERGLLPMRDAAGLSAAVGVLGTAVVYVLSPLLVPHDQPTRLIMCIASTALAPALLTSVLRGEAMGAGRWRRVALERCSTGAMRLFGTVALFVTSDLSTASAAGVIAASYFAGIPFYILWRSTATSGAAADAVTSPARATRAQVLSYGMQIWVGSFSGIVLSRLDQVLMTPLSSAHELGLYAVAVNVSESVLVVNYAIRDLAFSTQSKAFDAALLGRSSRQSTLATLTLGATVAILTPALLPLIFGQDFAAAEPALFVLLIAIVLGNPGSVAGAGLSALGRPQLRSRSLLIGAGVNAVALVLLVPSAGALGGAIATLIGNFVAGNANILWLARLGVPAKLFYRFRLDDIRSAAVR